MRPDGGDVLSQPAGALEFVDRISQRLNARPDDPLTVKGVRLLFRTMAEVSAMFGIRDGSGMLVWAQMANYGLGWKQLTYGGDHRLDGFYLFKNKDEPLAFVSYPRVTIDPGAVVELEFIRFDLHKQYLRQEK